MYRLKIFLSFLIWASLYGKSHYFDNILGNIGQKKKIHTNHRHLKTMYFVSANVIVKMPFQQVLLVSSSDAHFGRAFIII